MGSRTYRDEVLATEKHIVFNELVSRIWGNPHYFAGMAGTSAYPWHIGTDEPAFSPVIATDIGQISINQDVSF